MEGLIENCRNSRESDHGREKIDERRFKQNPPSRGGQPYFARLFIGTLIRLLKRQKKPIRLFSEKSSKEATDLSESKAILKMQAPVILKNLQLGTTRHDFLA